MGVAWCHLTALSSDLRELDFHLNNNRYNINTYKNIYNDNTYIRALPHARMNKRTLKSVHMIQGDFLSRNTDLSNFFCDFNYFSFLELFFPCIEILNFNEKSQFIFCLSYCFGFNFFGKNSQFRYHTQAGMIMIQVGIM